MGGRNIRKRVPHFSPYKAQSPFDIFKKRIPWLILLTLSSTFTGFIISAFEGRLEKNVALTVFIPMLMGTGGNCGSQSAIAVIRSLSLGEISLSDSVKVLLKEFSIALLCAAVLSVITFVKIMTVDRALTSSDINIFVALAVSLTLFITVCASKLVGASLPLVASRLKLDPAVMASPFVTTLVDTLTLAVYFTVSGFFI